MLDSVGPSDYSPSRGRRRPSVFPIVRRPRPLAGPGPSSFTCGPSSCSIHGRPVRSGKCGGETRMPSPTSRTIVREQPSAREISRTPSGPRRAEEIACSRAAELFHLIDQAQPARDSDRLNAIVGTGLAIDVVKVELDGRLRHEQSLRDRLSP